MSKRPPRRPPAWHDVDRLERDVVWAIDQSFAPGELLPMVERLLRLSERDSATWGFAHRQLAELVVERQPWRAASAARQAARVRPDDDAAHGLLGLALTVLGHYHSAAHAYRRALSLAPDNPWYAHNLGHLLDHGLGRPVQAVPWLRQAHAATPHPEIAASLAHALGRVGRAAEGLVVLRRGLRGEELSTDHRALEEWLVQGAPARLPAGLRRRAGSGSVHEAGWINRCDERLYCWSCS